jgi:hypothetical protein
VTATAVGKRRVYQLAAEPLPDLLAWVAPYHERWTTSLARLAETLDEEKGS